MTGLLRVVSVVVGLQMCLGAYAEDVPKTGDGVPIVHWKQASEYYGKEVIVYGRIVLSRNIGIYTFLNFDRDYSKHFTILIKQESYKNFPQAAERLYEGKFVAVRGEVIRYRDKPEIVATSPEQIAILPEDAPDPVAVILGKPPVSKASDQTPATPVQAKALRVASVNMKGVLQEKSPLCAADDAAASAATPLQRTASQVIHHLNADVLAVQNAGDSACLQRFGNTLLEDLGYDYFAGHKDPKTGKVEAALLSRYPLSRGLQVTEYYTKERKTKKFHRPPLEAHVKSPDGGQVKLVVISIPAQDDTFKLHERRAEFKGLRRYIEDELSLHAEMRLVVCGGFGEDLQSKQLSLLTEDDLLTIPGYVKPSMPHDQLPFIAQMKDFILTSWTTANYYAAGSTRIEKPESMPPAAALTLNLPVARGQQDQQPQAPAQRPASQNHDF